jgi:hypothetical protein
MCYAMDIFDYIGSAFVHTRFMLRHVHSHLLLSAMLPVLSVALDNLLSYFALLPVFESFVKEMRATILQETLKDDVQSHISIASDQPLVVKTVIDEIPHPSQNSMDYVKSSEFFSAIDVTLH